MVRIFSKSMLMTLAVVFYVFGFTVNLPITNNRGYNFLYVIRAGDFLDVNMDAQNLIAMRDTMIAMRPWEIKTIQIEARCSMAIKDAPPVGTTVKLTPWRPKGYKRASDKFEPSFNRSQGRQDTTTKQSAAAQLQSLLDDSKQKAKAAAVTRRAMF